MQVLNTEILAEPIDILNLLKAQTGLFDTIKASGNNIQFTCPFHGDGHEHKPSCGISTVETYRENTKFPIGTVHCFSCGYTSTDLATFVSDIFGYHDAGIYGYKWLIKHFLRVEVDERKPLELDLSRKHIVTALNKQYISEDELKNYRYIHPYMYKRKFNDKCISYFDIGYNKDEQCLTFPVKDLSGNVVFIYKRSIHSKFFINQKDTPRGEYLYLLYEAYQNLSSNKYTKLWVCESPIDAISAWQHGKMCVAGFSTSFTPIQIQLIKDFPLREVVIATDSDSAGEKSYAKLYDNLNSYKLIKRFKAPQGKKDLNDLTEDDWQKYVTY